MSYSDVLTCFSDRRGPQSVIDRLAAEWAGYYGLPKPRLSVSTPVRRECWTGRQVGEHLDRLAKIQPLLITDDKPRRLSGPLVLVDFGNGRIGQIDGRRRANVWRHDDELHEVLILCAF